MATWQSAVGRRTLGLTGLVLGCVGCADPVAAAMRKFQASGSVTIAGIRIEDHRPGSMVIAEAVSIGGVIVTAVVTAIVVGAIAVFLTDREWLKLAGAVVLGGAAVYMLLAGSIRGQKAVFDLRAREVHLTSSGWFGRSHTKILFGEVRALESIRAVSSSEDGKDRCAVEVRKETASTTLASTSSQDDCDQGDGRALEALVRIVETEMKLDVKRR